MLKVKHNKTHLIDCLHFTKNLKIKSITIELITLLYYNANYGIVYEHHSLTYLI